MIVRGMILKTLIPIPLTTIPLTLDSSRKITVSYDPDTEIRLYGAPIWPLCGKSSQPPFHEHLTHKWHPFQ